MAVLPVFISFSRWANQIKNDFPNVSIPVATSEEEWREWAAQLISANDLANVPRPTKLAYPNQEDWKLWAGFFINGIYSTP